LTIYLGPALIALTWPTMLRKLIRVAKEQRITTVSDFIASRYGKSAALLETYAVPKAIILPRARPLYIRVGAVSHR